MYVCMYDTVSECTMTSFEYERTTQKTKKNKDTRANGNSVEEMTEKCGFCSKTQRHKERNEGTKERITDCDFTIYDLDFTILRFYDFEN